MRALGLLIACLAAARLGWMLGARSRPTWSAVPAPSPLAGLGCPACWTAHQDWAQFGHTHVPGVRYDVAPPA